nr:MAG TPA: hypothetical protein [Caudoviricetes sp.]
MFSIHPIEVMWAQAPSDIKVNLALSLIVEILKISDGGRAEITLDDGKYEIKLNKLD